MTVMAGYVELPTARLRLLPPSGSSLLRQRAAALGCRPLGPPLRRRRQAFGQPFGPSHGVPEMLRAEMRVPHRHRQSRMAQDNL